MTGTVERAPRPTSIGCAAARGDHAAREGELREAHRLFVAMGAMPRAEKVAQEIGQ